METGKYLSRKKESVHYIKCFVRYIQDTTFLTFSHYILDEPNSIEVMSDKQYTHFRTLMIQILLRRILLLSCIMEGILISMKMKGFQYIVSTKYLPIFTSSIE